MFNAAFRGGATNQPELGELQAAWSMVKIAQLRRWLNNF
jgi:hypothetical protein